MAPPLVKTGGLHHYFAPNSSASASSGEHFRSHSFVPEFPFWLLAISDYKSNRSNWTPFSSVFNPGRLRGPKEGASSASSG